MSKILPPSSANNLTYGSQVVTGDGAIALDLVVVIDTSGSMTDESSDLSKDIDIAIQKALEKCPSKLRVTFLGIEGTWDDTKFDQSASDYLKGLGVPESRLQARKPFKEADGRDHAGNKEDLCRAVIDLSKHFDWRDGARRAVFVLGDEGMEGGGGVLTNAAKIKNDEAIAVAQHEKVKVYTYQGTPDDSVTNIDRFPSVADRDRVTKEYVRLAEQTGGRSYIYTTGIANFSLVLQEILCDSLTLPKIPKPHDKKSSCSHVCEQLASIISTVNTLAEIINKTIDSCCKDEWGNRQLPAKDCD
ncbi:VWA domain-containing protein [Proteus appendicitidis]|uniref:VWA domain-containing protein n=2 Tax=Proteus appendicitidis TaxID=3034648 RepID=A0ABY8YCT0_9GAMM|nr:VWA domain-containing protein [Proteus sp. HZ0627]WIV90273.1 VWA domain-containing protein [Proteus sp. HZ0627]